MLTSPFFRRLFLPNLLLIGVAVTVVGMVAVQRLSTSQTRSAEQSLRDETRLIARLLAANLHPQRLSELRAQVAELGEVIERRITVIAADGTVLADNEADPALMENHASRDEVMGARSVGEGAHVRRSGTVNDSLMYFARRVEVAGEPFYYVRLALHLRDLQRNLWALYRGIVLAVGLAIFGAAAISYFLAGRHAKPLIELTELADALRQGELDRRAIVAPFGEISALAAALNSMAQSLGELIARTRQDKARLLAILSSMSEGVIATDSDQRVLLHNSAAAALLDVSASALQGRYLWEVIRSEPLLHAAGEVLRTSSRQTVDAGQIAGRHLKIAICTFPADDHHHQPARGLVIVAHDVTESVGYQDLRKEFVANVSHELRTPLTAIKGFTETLLDGAIDDPQRATHFLRTIDKHADQLANLVNDLLELSRLESQPGLQHAAAIDVGQVVRKAADLLRPLADKKSQRVVVTIDPAAPVVQANADYIGRAVTNLLENAIKYSPEHSLIRVATGVRDEHLYIEVADEGIGIPAADLHRIFERFYRVDRSRSRDMGGTGLGLAIVKHIAQAHRGRVDVVSTPGLGSTFTLTLPLSDLPEPGIRSSHNPT